VRTIVNILPPRPCLDCERLTTLALVTDEWTPNFTPQCAYHGYYEPPTWRKPTQEERDLERASIVRFVIAAHSDMGQARVIRPVDPASVPGYVRTILIDEDDRDLPESKQPQDKAWLVRHHRQEKQWKYGWAIWHDELFIFQWIKWGVDEPERISVEQEVAS